MSAIDAVDDFAAGITLRNFAVDVAEKPMSGFGTMRKYHRRLATSAFGRLTDIRNVGSDFRL